MLKSVMDVRTYINYVGTRVKRNALLHFVAGA